MREQHGNRWAVTYKDPAAITEPNKATRINQLAPLSDLVFGLDHSFLAGRLGSNNQRDFPVTEIRRRFDHTINSSVPITPTRFGITDNILLVKEFEYPHIDLAYQQITMTETKKILDVYTSYWSVSQPITPTIMFAHEEYYRPLNLDSKGTYSNIAISDDGYDYTLTLPTSVPDGSTLAPVQVITATALSWAPYIYQDGEWAGAPLDAYLLGMRDIYPPETIDPDPAVAEGALIFLEEYYANIYQGCFNIVEEGEEHIVSTVEETDEVMTEYLERWEIYWEPIKIGMECLLEIVNLEGELRIIFNNIYFKVTGNGTLKEFSSLFKFEEMTWKGGVGLAAELIFGIAWLITHLPPINEKLDESEAGSIISIAISGMFVVFGAYKAISAIGKLPHHHSAANGSKSTEFGFWGMVIVTCLLILATIGIFIYMMATNQELNGIQIGMMVANLFATIIVIVIFAIISYIPVIGPLIVAIYNFINTILSELLGINFTEMLIQALTEIFYDVDPMTSLEPTVGETLYGFLSEKGVSEGNGVNISFPMAVKASQEDPANSRELRIINDVEVDLKGTRASIEVDSNESVIDQNSDWHSKEWDHLLRMDDTSGALYEQDMYNVTGDLIGQLDTIHFTQAGLNQAFSYDSTFDYQIHFWRCILWIFCSDRKTKGSVEQEPPELYFDVFPADIDGFAAWNWSGDELSFSAPQDRDNDGLMNIQYHGNDPDDTKWDTDGDTLSDSWEMDMAAKPTSKGGFAFNPILDDTDHDGLRDEVEARLGSDPAHVDSDSDGRTDLEEVNGYNFYYALPLFALVRSSPLIMDTDGDGLDDETEYLLHKMDPVSYPYNPNVPNKIPFSLQMTAGFSGYVGLGATFPLTVTVQNGSGTPIKGELFTQLPAGLTAFAPTQAPFEVLGEQSRSIYNNIRVATSVPASQLPITSTACGALEMPLVYLPFDETAPPFHNIANSGYYDAVSSPGSPASIPGRIGNAVYFSNPYNRLTLTQSSSDLNFSGATTFSLSAWVNLPPTSRTDYFYIIAKTDITSRSHGYNLYLKPNSNGGYDIGFNNEQKDYRFNQNLQAATWYNLIAISDGTKLKVYVNGVEAAGTQMTGVLTGPSANPVALGAIPSYNYIGYENAFQGALDELYIFDYPLSNQQIYSLSHPVAAQVTKLGSQASTSTCDLSASQSITVTVDTDLPTASLISPANGSYLSGSGFQVIGGEAHDPTSFIRSVEVSVDGNPFQPASGKEIWAYTLDMRSLAQGNHTLVARATDAVGHTGLSNSAFIKIDRDPPSVTLQPEIWPLPLRPQDIQTWVQHFNGTITDERSGVSSLEILVDGGPNLPYGGWQTATVSGTSWSVDYKFPVNVVDLNPIPNPTGIYTLSLRTTDKVGNTATVTDPASVIFDNNPPTVSLTNLSPTATITAPLTLSGVITNTEGGGPYGLQVALVPVEQSDVTLDAALAMHLNDRSTVNGQNFLDASGFNQTGYSESGRTPLVYEPGKVDEAVYFDGVDDTIQWREPLKTPITTTLTAAMWIKVKNTPIENTTLLNLNHAAAFYWKTKGGLTFSVTDSNGYTSEASSNMMLTDAQWHHVVGVWTGMANYIYIDGIQVGAGKPVGLGLLDTSSSLLALGNSAQGGNAFGGWVDEVYLFSRAFSNQEAANLFILGKKTWNWANLTDNLAPHTTWSYTLPAGQEGLYELELRGVDYLGNRNDNPASWNAWQGEIDMPGPQVTLQTVNHDLTTQVRCTATDLNLSRTGYQCPCTTLPEDLVTYDQVDNWYKEVIVDHTRLYKIMSTCDVSSSSAPFFMQACDIYGSCSQATSGAPVQMAGPETDIKVESSPTPENSPTAEVTPAPEIIPTLESSPTLEASPNPKMLFETEASASTEIPGSNETPDAPEVLGSTEISEMVDALPSPNSSAVAEATTTLEATPTPEASPAVDASFAPEATPTVVGAPALEGLPPGENQTGLEATAPVNVSLLPVSILVEPVDHSVLTSLDPVSLTVHAEAASGLREITLSVNGDFLTSFDFPDASVTGYAGSTTWTPPPGLVDGAYIFKTSARDWNGQIQESPFTSTIFIDTLPPTVDISPTVFTSTHMVSNWGVNLSGPVSDLAGVSEVEVGLHDSGTWYRASVKDGRWSYPRMPEVLPDGEVVNLDVQAADLGGHTTLVTREVTADLVPPSLVTMTLSYVNSQGVLTPVRVGQTIYDVLNPTIQISWTPASDGSGVRRYYAGLSQQESPDLSNLAAVNPEGQLQVDQVTVEAQAYTAFVVSEDIYGNRSVNQVGPFYADTPLTPDLIAMPGADIYHGWMDSGESEIGFNRILLDTLPPGLSLSHAQKFYLSWDVDALRIAWLGADWDSEGDLFIYLKTGSSAGTDQAYNPYPATAGDTLTLPFAADTLVWVTNTQTAQFLRWNGTAWYDALPGGLPPEVFRFTAHAPRSITDLYLPFELLGISDPTTTPLDLIAFGSEGDALRLWTVFPIFNPHDSPILSRLLFLLPDQHNIVMWHGFHWNNLALEQSPTSSRYLDVDLRAIIQSNPTGVISDTRNYGLFLRTLFKSGRVTQLLGNNQAVNYTLDYLNTGGASAPGERLVLRVTTHGSMVLQGGTPITNPDGSQGYFQQFDLGPVEPLSRGKVAFTGMVTYSQPQVEYELCRRLNPNNPAACQTLHDLADSAADQSHPNHYFSPGSDFQRVHSRAPAGDRSAGRRGRLIGRWSDRGA